MRNASLTLAGLVVFAWLSPVQAETVKLSLKGAY
jgi:hypothetical protein